MYQSAATDWTQFLHPVAYRHLYGIRKTFKCQPQRETRTHLIKMQRDVRQTCNGAEMLLEMYSDIKTHAASLLC